MIGLVCAIAGFMGMVLCHLAALRRGWSHRHFRTLGLLGVVFFALSVAGAAVWEAWNPVVTFPVMAVVFALFFYGVVIFAYFIFIYIVDSSSATRILIEIEESPERQLSFEELMRRYSLEEKFQDILKDLKFIGAIEEKDGEFRNTTKGERHARVVGGFRRFFHIGGHL